MNLAGGRGLLTRGNEREGGNETGLDEPAILTGIIYILKRSIDVMLPCLTIDIEQALTRPNR